MQLSQFAYLNNFDKYITSSSCGIAHFLVASPSVIEGTSGIIDSIYWIRMNKAIRDAFCEFPIDHCPLPLANGFPISSWWIQNTCCKFLKPRLSPKMWPSCDLIPSPTIKIDPYRITILRKVVFQPSAWSIVVRLEGQFLMLENWHLVVL